MPLAPATNASSSPGAAKICLFCGRGKQMSKEHLWPKWAQEAIAPDQRGKNIRNTRVTPLSPKRSKSNRRRLRKIDRQPVAPSSFRHIRRFRHAATQSPQRRSSNVRLALSHSEAASPLRSTNSTSGRPRASATMRACLARGWMRSWSPLPSATMLEQHGRPPTTTPTV